MTAPPLKMVEHMSDAELMAAIEAGPANGRTNTRWAQLAREAVKRWRRDRYPPPDLVEALNAGGGTYRP